MNAKRFPVALRWAGRSGRSPRASDGRHRQEAGVAPQALSFGAVQRATMARGAEARAAMVAAADLRLAEAGVPNPPRHADISRSDLSQPLHPDPRRAEKGAVGAVAYCAADASPQEPQREEWTGAYPRYGLYPRAARRD